MPSMIRSIALLLALFLAVSQAQTAQIQGQHAVPSTLKFEQGRYQIFRGDQPYFIKGGGGSGNMALLAASGGNSVRTWGTNNAQSVLDNAQANGLTVMLGLRLGHERQAKTRSS